VTFLAHREALKGLMPGGTPVLDRTQVYLVCQRGEDEGDAAALTAGSA
jgi:hypothetical protein